MWCAGTPTWPTRSSSADRPTASVRRSWRWWRRPEGATIDPRSIREFVAEEIARFKAPRAVAVVGGVRRHANGKPDYGWAKEAALTAADATAGGGGR